ncbi:class I SAM-dependent methyltransferase [Amycolatopsis magusensis]|uniref:class I SAM-dependent methyltransferase n=1 Tax=Amycolatopsis magusensis TaxID=882444 RepID=UPI0037BB30A7
MTEERGRDGRIGREPQYEVFADAFAEHAENGAFNALYDRPAMLGLLGEVHGAQVLDAACGPGLYAAELVARGARVTGMDQSPRMVELATARVPEAEFRVHDLHDPFDWLPDATFDVALLALAIHHLDDRVPALRELHRVLKPSGRLLISTGHPSWDWLRTGGDYFETELITETWTKGWRVSYWRQPLSAVCAEFSAAGFVIDELVEPRPAEQMAQHYPENYAQLNEAPAFLAFRLTKRGQPYATS